MIASSIYHGLQLLAEKSFSNGLQFLVTYTWSKSIDDSSQADDNVTWLGSFSSLQDPNKPWLERSLSTFDIPHVFQVQLQLRSADWARARVPGQHAAVGRCAHRRMEDERHLAHRRRTAADLHGCRRKSSSDVWQAATQHRGNAQAQSWLGLGGQLLCGQHRVPASGRFHDGQRSARAGKRSVRRGTSRPICLWESSSRLREEMNFEVRIEAQNAFNHPVFQQRRTRSVDDPNFGRITFDVGRTAAGAVGGSSSTSKIVFRRWSLVVRFLHQLEDRWQVKIPTSGKTGQKWGTLCVFLARFRFDF